MYMVFNDPEEFNGRTFIGDSNVWHEITSNMAATDSNI